MRNLDRYQMKVVLDGFTVQWDVNIEAPKPRGHIIN